MKIVCIDDSKSVHNAVENAFVDLNLPIFCETSAESALTLIEANPTTVIMVLLDSNLPGVSSIDVLKRLKTNPHTLRIPVIFMVNPQQSALSQEALKSGATGYVQKPFPKDELLNHARRILSRLTS